MNKLEELIWQLNHIKQTNKEDQDKFQIKKKYLEKKIEKILDKKNKTSYSFCLENEVTKERTYFKATSVKPKKIEWNMETLKQILDKEIFDEVCIKKYTIIDYEGFVEYLKSLKADPKIFKGFIQCEKSMNQNKLDQLSELGEVSVDDLEGCYNVINKESYIRITQSEEEIADEE